MARLIDSLPTHDDLPPPGDGPVRFRGGPLSNFYVSDIHVKHPFVVPGEHRQPMVHYLTGEHRFQAMKALSYKEHEYVRSAPTAQAAKTRGRSLPLNPLWEFAKVEVMREVLMAKAASSQDFYNALMATGEREIIEDAPWDSVWGCGPDGRGKNLLGKLLMELRDYLRTSGGER